MTARDRYLWRLGDAVSLFAEDTRMPKRAEVCRHQHASAASKDVMIWHQRLSRNRHETLKRQLKIAQAHVTLKTLESSPWRDKRKQYDTKLQQKGRYTCTYTLSYFIDVKHLSPASFSWTDILFKLALKSVAEHIARPFIISPFKTWAMCYFYGDFPTIIYFTKRPRVCCCNNIKRFSSCALTSVN